MTNYRRAWVEGGSYFFTVALEDRGQRLLLDRIDELRHAFQITLEERPFRCDAIVVLPEHIHAVWTLPPGDRDYSTRWRLIKSRFSRSLAEFGSRSPSKREKQERGLWQRRFWEHCIRNEADFSAHIRHCRGNPVKHGLARRPADWPYSSIHRDIRLGRADAEWHGEVPAGEFGERA